MVRNFTTIIRGIGIGTEPQAYTVCRSGITGKIDKFNYGPISRMIWFWLPSTEAFPLIILLILTLPFIEILLPILMPKCNFH